MSTSHVLDFYKQSATPTPMEHENVSAFEHVEMPVSSSDSEDDKQEYPTGLKLATITSALCLSVFCVALDNTV